MKTVLRSGLCATLALAMMLGFAHPAAASGKGKAAPEAGASPLHGQLENYVRHGKPVMFIKMRIDEAIKKDPRLIPAALNWVRPYAETRDNEKFNSLYFMVYSDLNRLSLRTVKQNSPQYRAFLTAALQNLLALEVALTADFARCRSMVDPSTAGLLIAPRYEALNFAYGVLNQKEMQRVWDYALRAEAAMAARAPNKEICSGGVNIGLAFMQGAPAEIIPKPVEAKFIDDDDWQKERNDIRAELRKYWEKRYMLR